MNKALWVSLCPRLSLGSECPSGGRWQVSLPNSKDSRATMAPSLCHQSKRLSYTLPLGIEPLTKAMTSGHDCHISCQVKHPTVLQHEPTDGWLTSCIHSFKNSSSSLLRSPITGSSLLEVAPCLIFSHPHTSLPCPSVTCSPITSKLPSTPAPLNRLNFRFLFAILSPPAFPLLPMSCISSVWRADLLLASHEIFCLCLQATLILVS